MTEISPIEPNRLKLIWQSSGPDRNKYTVGELIRSGPYISLSYFHSSTEIFAAMTAGFTGHAAFPLYRPVYHENVVETFARRLPSRQRNDFHFYLKKNRLAQTYISDFSLLGYTGAYLPSDGFSFAIDWRFQELPYLFLMEVSGFRYHSGMLMPMDNLIGRSVTFVSEDNNQYDRNAVALYVGNDKIGYIPRYYAADFRFWHAIYEISATVERIDGALAKPQVSILIYVRGRQHTNALAGGLSGG
jgi:HIRAN domain